MTIHRNRAKSMLIFARNHRKKPHSDIFEALFVFGYVKGKFTVARPMRSAWQTLAVGSCAAAAAYVIAKLVGG